jgi:hypothetical protein
MMSERSLLFPANGKIASTSRERRVWARYPTSVGGTCQPVAAETASEPEMAWPGEIVTISCGGITLALERRFQPGTSLVIEIESGDEEPSRFFEVVVIHVKPEADDRWLHGCELRIKLSEEDLQAFV